MAIQGLVTTGWLAVVATGPDGPLGRIAQTGVNHAWTTWGTVGPAITGAPAVTHNSDGCLEIFAVDEEGALGRVRQTEIEGPWSSWVSFRIPVSGDPVVFHNADGRLEIFARGEDGRLGHMWEEEGADGSGWSKWEQLGPEIAGRPTVFQNQDGRLEVFARGAGDSLGHMWQFAPNGLAGWSEWEDLGPVVLGDPALFQNDDGRLEVFARGPGGVLGHTWQEREHGGWAPWDELGSPISGDPAVFQNWRGRLELFAIGPDGLLGHMWQLDPGLGWSGWGELGPPVSSDPVVFQNRDGRLEVFAIGPEGVLGHIWQTRYGGETAWSDWTDLGPAGVGNRLAVGQSGVSTSDPVEAPPAPPPERGSRTPRALGADVLVIGAGPAGITVAAGLVEAGATVLLAESGGLDEDPAAQELNNGVADGPIVKYHRTYLRDGRRRQVQGSASGWGIGWCMPFRSNDFEARSWVANSGWPIGHADLGPYETKAAATFGFEPFDTPRSDGGLVRLLYQYPTNPMLFRSKYLDLLVRPRFRSELGATAVELRARGDRVQFVRFALADGRELRVTADRVVLATGGVENARLLLLHEHTLGTSAMTGRCFMEHPHLLAGTVHFPMEQEEALRPLLPPEPPHPREVLALPDATLANEGLLNAGVQLRRSHHATPRAGHVACELYVRAEQAPNVESRLVLGGRLDRLGFREPVLHWRLLDQDWTSIVRTARLVASDLEGRYGVTSELAIREDEPWPWDPAGPSQSSYAAWGNHHLGTTRMADNPNDGVVDPDGLLFGTSNVYLAGSSVFPTGACANPTFTIVAMAHRLVDQLAQTADVGATSAVEAV